MSIGEYKYHLGKCLCRGKCVYVGGWGEDKREDLYYSC